MSSKRTWCSSLIAVILLGLPTLLLGQHASNGGLAGRSLTMDVILGLLELPFLLLCVYFAFVTARALDGGIFGSGMRLVAWGFLVMAIGHLHMQIAEFTGFNLFTFLLGEMGGSVAWVVALMLTWGLSGIGFYKMYNVSRTV